MKIEGKGELFGLVLAGGKSTRMGEDKGILQYHGVPQREYTVALLNSCGIKTFLSVRSDQQDQIPTGMDVILDRDEFRGPFNGLLSAHRAYPDVAWLVVACDMPLLKAEDIAFLIQERDPERMATAFATVKSGLPEPLAAIWEPAGLAAAMTYLETAMSSCARKFLINHDTKLVHPKDDRVLANANDPETFRELQEYIATQ